MRYLYLSIFFILFFSSSCKKKQLEFKFEGNIKSSNLGGELKGVTVKAYAYGLEDNNKILKGSTQTDAGGNYVLNIERGRYKKIVIELSKHNYFTYSKTFPFDDLSTEETNSFNSTLSPKSWTKFIFKNISSQNQSDELKIQKVSGKTDCATCCPNGYTYYYGIVDTVVYCPNDGGTYMKFYYWVNGTMMSGVDSVYNTPFDTIPYPITY